MDDPNGELRRQRELVAAHLRWLDEQLARTSGQASPSPAPAFAPPVAPAPPPLAASPLPVSVLATPTAPEAPLPDIALPEIDPGSIRNEVRRGCFIYVIIVTVLLAASTAVAVWIARE